MTTLKGKCSWFGGPEDKGVSPDEGLAFIYSVDMAPHLFLPRQPAGTTGLARRLDPSVHFVACRWDYSVTPKDMLLDMIVTVRAPKTGKEFRCYPADWGPHQDTGRVADLSKGLMDALAIKTDDEVEVRYEPLEVEAMAYNSICISSGHGLYVRGANGEAYGGFDEVDEARRQVERLGDELDARGVSVSVWHDDKSKTQSENLNAIVNWHNSQGAHDLDISCHFNASESHEGHGVEVLYYSQKDLAAKLSSAIAEASGLTNRGAKKRTDLKFLNSCKAPAVLLETAFCDNQGDWELYEVGFDRICDAIANVLGGAEEVTVVPPEEEVKPPAARVDITIEGDVTVTVNGKLVLP